MMKIPDEVPPVPLLRTAVESHGKEMAKLMMIDMDGRGSVYLITPRTLGEFLPSLLGAAAGWIGKPGLEEERIFQSAKVMPAKSIGVREGTTPDAVVLAMRIGKMELAFQIPAAEAVKALGEVAKRSA